MNCSIEEFFQWPILVTLRERQVSDIAVRERQVSDIAVRDRYLSDIERQVSDIRGHSRTRNNEPRGKYGE